MANRPDTSHVPRPTSQALRSLTIGIIGAGKMGQALLKGLLAHGISRRRICAADPDAATRTAVGRRFHLTVTSQNVRVVKATDVVILAVKPQQLAQVITEIAPHVTRHQLVVSIAAGISLRWLQARFRSVPVVRVMPNLPATVGCGFAAIALGRAATTHHRAIVQELFSAVGQVVELPERYFDAVTAVSGSGPAYVFFLVQMWEKAARSLGLPPAVSAKAIRQTLAGSVRLLHASHEPAASLIQQVASKGGTTEAALRVLAKRSVPSHFVEALRAAARRSKELSWR